MLECTAPDWSRVLDLYAGTGALGIEALSRGAGWADFIEQSAKCCAIIKQNLERTGLAEKAKVYCSDAEKALSFLSGGYGIILVDPPYFDSSVSFILPKLASSALVAEETSIVVEHSRRLALEGRYGDFQMTKNLRHGDTCISVYQFSGGEA